MNYCEHYFACREHRGRTCGVCGEPLLYVPYEVAPAVARCHVLPVSSKGAA